MKKNMLLAFFAILFLFCMSGCSSYLSGDPTPGLTTAASPPPVLLATKEPILPKNGGTVSLAMRNPKTLNPLLNEDTSVDRILKLIFEPITVLDETLNAVANNTLIERIEFSTDGKTVFITLKGGLKWSDGRDITARDIEFSLNLLKNAPENAVYKACVDNILSCSIVNNFQVRINLDKANGGTVYFLCLPIIPEHYYNDNNLMVLNSEKNMKPLGNGLFRFDYFNSAKELGLVYSDVSLKGRPYIDRVTAILTEGANDIYSFDNNVIQATVVDFFDRTKHKGLTNAVVYEFASNNFEFIGFNFERDYFKDLSVRKAIAYSVPLGEIAKNIYSGSLSLSAAFVNPESLFYEPETLLYGYDPTKARETFEASQYFKDNGELSFSILVNSENAERMMIAELLKKNLNILGINAYIKSVAFDEYVRLLELREYDMFIGGYSLGTTPDFSFALSSEQAYTGLNYFNYQSEIMDVFLENASNAKDAQEYKEALRILQIYVSNDLPVIGIGFKNKALIVKSDICGQIDPSPDNVFVNFKEWFLNH